MGCKIFQVMILSIVLSILVGSGQVQRKFIGIGESLHLRFKALSNENDSLYTDSFALIPDSGKSQAIQESGIPFDNFHHVKQIVPGLGFGPLTC